MQRVSEEPKYCCTCGTKIFRKRFNGRLEDLGAWNRRKFCSLSCANTKEKVGYDGNSWRARKHLKAICEHCGIHNHNLPSGQGLHAHHINLNRDDNRRENIRTLCGRCHALLHHGNLELSESSIDCQTAWTALDASETPSSRKSRKKSAK